MTEPASLTAMRQLVAEARLRRAGPRAPRDRPVPPAGQARRGAPEQEAADAGQHDAEDELADADERSAPLPNQRHRRHEEHDGDAEDEQADSRSRPGVAGEPGA